MMTQEQSLRVTGHARTFPTHTGSTEEQVLDAYELWLRVNGNGHAFLKEPGCTCGRCRPVAGNPDYVAPQTPPAITKLEDFPGVQEPCHRAATSVSLLLVSRGEVQHHILVDVGPGVCDSLCDAQLDPPGCLLGSHWHHDHVGDLNRLVESRRRHWRGARPDPGGDCPRLPVFCTSATRSMLERSHSFECERLLEFSQATPGIPLTLGAAYAGGRALPLPTITPIAVEHGHVSDAAVIYLVEFGGKRTLLAWDLAKPPAVGHVTGRLDLLLAEANTWNPRPRTGHVSLLEVLDLIKQWEPESALALHLSGHEDRVGDGAPRGYGWTDTRWHREINAEWDAVKPSDGQVNEVGVAFQGMLRRIG